MKDYEFHKIASLFPLMNKKSLNKLAESIRTEGLNLPIVLYEEKILDGRNRYLACKIAGVEPRFITYGGDNPWEFVWSENAERRHLTDMQKYFIWLEKNEKSARWQAVSEEIHKEANRKRSEAAKAQPRTEDGTRLASGSGTDSTTTSDPHKTRSAKAQASRTNMGAVAKGDYLYDRRPDLAHKVISGDMSFSSALREARREEAIQKLEAIENKKAKELAGVFDVVVIDPPWPMQKIERDERPNQVHLDYPTMTEEELAALKIPAAQDCHVFLWTTQKFLQAAFRLLDAWGLKYTCAFVWHKPGGFQPYGLAQYNCEFVLYARKGSPVFIDQKAFCTCFHAPRGCHSEKPGAFYETIKRVTAGRRLDMFARRTIDGFEGWGKEAPESGASGDMGVSDERPK